VYIPRKFREDKFYVRDEEELEIVNVRFMSKFQTEYNLLKKRQRDFAVAINAEDDVIYGFIEHCTVSDVVKMEMGAIWERDVKADEDKINDEWKTKIQGMKTAYETDKQKLASLNRTRFAQFEQRRQDAARHIPDDNISVISEEDFEEADAEEIEESEPAQQESNEPVPTNETATPEINSVDTLTTFDSAMASTVTVRRHRSSVQNNAPSTARINAQTQPPLVVSTATSTDGNRRLTAPARVPPAPTAPATLPTAVSTEAEETDERLAQPAEEQTTDSRHIIDDLLTEDTIDASAPLFATTQNDDMGDDFATQDIDNIRNLAENFGVTPSRQNSDLQSNYKFRKRSPLK
jgi:hypothetical protein